MPPRRRPNAFEVTFPGEVQDESGSGTDGGNNRRRQRDNAEHYHDSVRDVEIARVIVTVVSLSQHAKRRKTNERPRARVLACFSTEI
jgi:DNA (cytosine-5)-methyltransferase 1